MTDWRDSNDGDFSTTASTGGSKRPRAKFQGGTVDVLNLHISRLEDTIEHGNLVNRRWALCSLLGFVCVGILTAYLTLSISREIRFLLASVSANEQSLSELRATFEFRKLVEGACNEISEGGRATSSAQKLCRDIGVLK